MKIYFCNQCKKTISTGMEEILIECKCGSREIKLISEIEEQDVVGKFILMEEG